MDEKPIRKSMRLNKYDYSTDGAYFITICVQNKQRLLGSISESGELNMNDAGKMVQEWFWELENKFAQVKCDEFICMPDHVHFIVFLQSEFLRTSSIPTKTTPDISCRGGPICPPSIKIKSPKITDIVQWFKTMTTNKYIAGVKQSRWLPFHERFWQRSFFDRVIRNDEELELSRLYIINNPTSAMPTNNT